MHHKKHHPNYYAITELVNTGVVAPNVKLSKIFP